MTAATEYLDALREESAYQRERREDAAERWGEVPEPIVPTVRDPKDYTATHELVDDTRGKPRGWRFVGRDEAERPRHDPVWPQRCRWCGCSAIAAAGVECDRRKQVAEWYENERHRLAEPLSRWFDFGEIWQ